MKDQSKWIIVGVAWIIQLLGVVFYVGEIKSDFDKMKEDLDKANVLVMQNEIKHLNTTATEIKSKVNEISSFIMTLGE